MIVSAALSPSTKQEQQQQQQAQQQRQFYRYTSNQPLQATDQVEANFYNQSATGQQQGADSTDHHFTMNPNYPAHNHHHHLPHQHVQHMHQQHHELDIDYDANNIEVNMTVQNPSVQQTASLASNSFSQYPPRADAVMQQELTIQYRLQQHQPPHNHSQQQQQQHYDQYYQPNQPASSDSKVRQQQQKVHQKQVFDDIMRRLASLLGEAQRTEQAIMASREAYQNFAIQYQNHQRFHANLKSLESSEHPNVGALEKMRRDMTAFDSAIRVKASELNAIRSKILQEQTQIFYRMSELQKTILYEHLAKWHQAQQTGLRSSQVPSLDVIQTWVEKLVDITWRLKNQIKGLQLTITQRPNVPFDIEKIEQFSLYIDRSLEDLILNTFVVEKQPPQVMKKDTRFQSTVRFLTGGRLNVQMINPTVKAIILSEAKARAIIQRHHEMIEASWSCFSQFQESLDGQSVLSPQSGDQQQCFQQHMPMTMAPTTGSSPTQNHPQQQQPPFDYPAQKVLNLNEFDPSGAILNNSNILEYQESSGHLLCHFRNMSLKKITRTEKKGTESVMDEKFFLLFHTEFRIADSSLISADNASKILRRTGDLSFQLMAFSLPVVVIVHENQKPQALATVTWHNAFAQPCELFYRVPDKVTWRQLGAVLSEKFNACAGRGLNRHSLDYLASKVYRAPVASDEVMITWNQFAKETLADKPFTFWEWFNSMLKLTREHLRDLWSADRIYGFVGKRGSSDILLGCANHKPAPTGSFLLRFSETELGGITIAWVSAPPQPNSKSEQNPDVQIAKRLSPSTTAQANVLMHLQPFGHKDLQTRSLADRIRDLKDLVLLYPDIPKDDAFKPFYTPLNEASHMTNGYVRPLLVTTLPTNYQGDLDGGGTGGSGASVSMSGISQNNSMDCTTTPSPPNSFSQSSPDGIYHDNAMLNNVEPTYAQGYEYNGQAR